MAVSGHGFTEALFVSECSFFVGVLLLVFFAEGEGVEAVGFGWVVVGSVVDDVEMGVDLDLDCIWIWYLDMCGYHDMLALVDMDIHIHMFT